MSVTFLSASQLRCGEIQTWNGCRALFRCHQNSSDPPSLGLYKTSEGTLWYLTFSGVTLRPVSGQVELPWIILAAPAYPSNAWSDLGPGNLEVRATPWTLRHVPQTIPEQGVLCGRAHYPALTRHSHEGIPLQWRVCTRSATMFRYAACQVDVHMNARNARVSRQNIAQNITLLPPACLIPAAFPGAISSPG